MLRSVVTKCVLGGMSLLAFMAVSCTDSVNVDDDIKGFVDETLADYVANDPSLSMFNEVLEKSKMSETSKGSIKDMLEQRGNYNVFAPSNDALTAYLNKLYKSKVWSLDTMSQTVANTIVQNCIIDNGNNDALLTSDFPMGAITQGTLNDRHIMVSVDSQATGGTKLLLNRKSRITTSDVQLGNGVLNIIDVVISPYQGGLPSLIASASNLKIFSYILEQTGWADSMLAYRDEKYETYTDEQKRNDSYFKSSSYVTPPHRYYGYMAFTETDDVFEKEWDIPAPVMEGDRVINEIEIRMAIEEKCKAAYPDATDDDWMSEKNPVNQFISYHLVPFKEPYSLLIRHGDELGYNTDLPEVYTMDLWTYFHTMGKPNRLFKLTQTVDGAYHINRMSYHNNAFDGDMKETSVVDPGISVSENNGENDNNALNGYYYPINKLLLYTDFTRDAVLNERIRYNIAQYFNEMMSNDLRTGMYRGDHYYIPHHPYRYCEHLRNEKTDTDYRTPINVGDTGWCGIESDQFAFSNSFDVTFQLIPVPFAGTWEVRWYCSNIASRGLAQAYFGTNPDNLAAIGMPIDFRIVGSNPKIGSITDTNLNYDSVLCLQNDVSMRTHMYMKACRTYCLNYFGIAHVWSKSLRNRVNSLRAIVYRGNMEPDKTYYLRFKTMLTNPSAYLFGDAIELVPESVWNNPKRQEDVW